jgi:hypothetical protein
VVVGAVLVPSSVCREGAKRGGEGEEERVDEEGGGRSKSKARVRPVSRAPRGTKCGLALQ